ncbi:MAG: cyclic nucleotide-binding domain-containing protein [Spirochaetales bacterium]|nr:cyclic nucleotide-binding domain-containing protein [Spirochaetales bacterium]
MPPKSITYNANSIVYFKGDRSNSVYVLKSGKISLNYTDLQTGQEVQDLIKTGEFFGVKAALGGYIHDETATVLVESQVLQFSVGEFEQLITGNQRILSKMLRVFSTQLRRIHNQVQNLMASDASTDPELGLFEVGRYYQKEGDPLKARAAFEKYLTYYPGGTYVAGVQKSLNELTAASSRKQTAPVGDIPSLFICRKKMDRGEYQDAYKGLTLLYHSPSLSDEEKPETEMLLGVCLYQLSMYKDAATQFTALVKKYPRHGRLDDICYYLGLSYHELGDREKAAGFLKKSVAMLKDNQKKGRASEILKELNEEPHV